jgi:hypothetical protein
MIWPAFYYCDNSIHLLFHILNRTNYLMDNNSPPAWISSSGIWSLLGDLYLFNFAITISTSKGLGSGTNGSTVCTSICPCGHSITEKSSSSAYSECCGNLQADRHSHPSLSYFEVGNLFLYTDLQCSSSYCLLQAHQFCLSDVPSFYSRIACWFHVLYCSDYSYLVCLDPVITAVFPASFGLIFWASFIIPWLMLLYFTSVKLFEISKHHCSFPSVSFNFLRLNLSIWTLCSVCLLTASLSLNLPPPDSGQYHNLLPWQIRH